MNKESFTAALEEQGFHNVRLLEMNEIPVDQRGAMPFYPRDQQLSIWKPRLKTSSNIVNGTYPFELNDDELLQQHRLMLPLIEEWVSKLEELDADVRLFIWKASSQEGEISGRCTEDVIVQIIPPELAKDL